MFHLLFVITFFTIYVYNISELQSLQSLSIADSKLKLNCTRIINALGTNETLTEIDLR